MATEIESVKRALAALYAPETESGVRREADVFLSRFQPSQRAWQTSMELLQAEPRASSTAAPGTYDACQAAELFFGAQTLHVKIRYDFGDITSGEQVVQLRHSLLSHLCRLAIAGAPRNVQTRLALALAGRTSTGY